MPRSGATGRVPDRRPDARAWPRDRLLAHLYDWEHDAFQDDVDLYVALARRTGGPALELACGTGRVLIGLLRSGVSVVGLDRSTAMLERARVRLKSGGEAVQLIEGDLRGPLPVGPFALAILALDAFGLVHETSAQPALLRGIAGRLQPGGLVVFDLVHAAAVADQPQGIPILQASGADESLEATVTKWIVRRVHPATQMIELHSFFDLLWPDATSTRVTDALSLRYFSRYEVELLLARAGLALEGVYGDYELGPLRDESERLVMVATAPGDTAC